MFESYEKTYGMHSYKLKNSRNNYLSFARTFISPAYSAELPTAKPPNFHVPGFELMIPLITLREGFSLFLVT